MKKYIVFILSLVLIIACKNTTTDSTKNQDNPAKPVTLAERAGTYEGSIPPVSEKERKITLKINNDGTAIFNSTFPAVSNANFIIANPSSIETTFTVNVVFSTTFTNDITIKFDSLTQISLTSPAGAGFNTNIYILNKLN